MVKLVGKVSMNLLAIDITNIQNELTLESEVCVISDRNEDLNSVLNYARLTGELPYEILIHLAPNIKRIIK
jgi:alanine racemase